MNKEIVDKKLKVFNIAEVKMKILVNKELYIDNTIDFEMYKYVENSLIDKLNKLESVC